MVAFLIRRLSITTIVAEMRRLAFRAGIGALDRKARR